MTIELPILQSCDGCGACCLQQGSPPGYLALLCQLPGQIPRWDIPEDIARFPLLPAEAVAELRAYREQLINDEVSGEGPCIWFDADTKRCRFHEHRPQICRDFERGCDECWEWRTQFDVPVPVPVSDEADTDLEEFFDLEDLPR